VSEQQELLEKVKTAKEQQGKVLTTEDNKRDFVQELLDKITKDKEDREQARADKKRANEFIGKIFGALQKIHSRRITHPVTRKFIGMKFKYVSDGEGKTIYDYIVYNKDPFEKKLLENMEFEFDENDNKDGQWIDKRIKPIWLNTKY
jgi:hypothetical protein